MRIVQVNPVVRFGSTGRIVESIGMTIQNRGWESYIAYSGRFQGKSSSHLLPIGGKVDSISHAVLTRMLDLHGLGSVNATKQFVSELELIKPDIIHLHNIHGYYLNYPQLVKYLNGSRIPIVWTLHDFWPITGHCTHYVSANCLKWQEHCSKCPKLSYYPKSYIDNSRYNFSLKKRLFTTLDNLTLVTVSRWVKQELEKSFLSTKEIRVINNGIDTNIFKPINHGLESIKKKYNLIDKFILLGLATNWTKGKGLDDYFKLSEKLSDEYLILLVGLSENQIKGLPANIKGITVTQDIQELVSLYSSADIVMNLSYAETFGLTTAEGFACGTPSIAYNCTASPELIDPEVGELVEPGDIQGVINAISFIRQKGKASYTGACRLKAETLYSADIQYNEYIKLYDAKSSPKK